VAVGDGSTVTNSAGGTVSTTGDNSGAVIVIGNGTLTNDGTISTGGADATAVLFTGEATIDNSGTIAAGVARGIDLAGASTVNNTGTVSGGTDGIRFNAGSTLNNQAGATVSGDTGVTGSTGDDTVVNFGTITGTTAAAALGDGSDAFQQWTGAAVTGDVDLGGGDDTFVLEGANSTVAGMILGGAGADTAVLGGTLDADNLMGFETNTLGTLFDLTISGDRTLSGDVVIDGVVNVGLGVDSLTNDGTITLENTGVINIATPLDEALLGQTVTVLQDGAGFTDNGATINIIDDDLLIDYTPIVGSLRVQVTGVNPLAGQGDANFANFGGVIAGGIRNGTISAANFAALNALGSAAEFQTAAADALPSLSGGVSREIFETSNVASQALDRHLAAEGSGVWGQIAIRGSEQEEFSASQDGYESDQTVITIGGDFAVGETARFGLLASYADIEVEDFQGNVPQETSDAESIKLGAYASWTPVERSFLNMELAYLTGEVESARTGFFGPITSGYDFDGFAARVTVGYDLLPDENVSLTPTLGINAADISFDDGTEAGGFGFLIERGDEVFIEGRAGLELGAQVSDKVDGFIQGTIIHDFADSPRSFRLSSAQLPTFTTNLPTPGEDRFELAAGMDVSVSDQFSIGLGYQGDFGGGYDAHSARATVRIGF
ncbi:MAG: autotransporter domain-containing protein, partial [Pseudomonadota bacterium]